LTCSFAGCWAADNEARAQIRPSHAVAGFDGRRFFDRRAGALFARAPARVRSMGGEMSVGFRAVQWNGKKLVYDGVLIVAVSLFIAGFVRLHWLWQPPKDLPAEVDIWIRAFGTCAFLMLTVILLIGPLTRLSPRFLPLLYNRRHFGVLTFVIAA